MPFSDPEQLKAYRRRRYAESVDDPATRERKLEQARRAYQRKKDSARMERDRNRVVTDDSWTKDANCRGVDPNLFFSERGENLTAQAAKQVCAGCSVREQCLDYTLNHEHSDEAGALRHGEWYGVWGGYTSTERKNMKGRITRMNRDLA